MSFEITVERRTPVPAPPEAVFAWHARPLAFERLVPPWRRVVVLERPPELIEGSRLRFRVSAGPLDVEWVAEHRDVTPGSEFTDIQVRGPFDRWVHTHRFEPAPGGAFLHDRIVCELPLGMRPGAELVRRELVRMLAWRHAVTAADLAMHATARGRPLHVGITGASGLIGSILAPVLSTGGHRVTRFVRRPAGPGEIAWDPVAGALDPGTLSGLDAVVHLAGENIAGGRWTAARKRRVIESRRRGTGLLADALARAGGGPRILVSASAIGYYGDRGDELLTETSAAGRGFLPEVCGAWESATEPAARSGVRVVNLRIGLPLTPAGGLLERMLLPFRAGVGGRLGSGAAWMSWISADDLAGAFHRALTDDSLRGPVNGVGPGPVTNAELTKTLGRILHRWTPFPVPAPLLRLLFGDMADEAILASARVIPAALQRAGYGFRHETLPDALAHVLGRTPA